jgi:HK97 family phage major capsid protein
MVANVRNGDGFGGSMGWALNPAILDQIMSIQSDAYQPDMPVVTTASTVTGGAGHQMARILISDAAPDRLLGFPYATTTKLTGASGVGAKSAIFGNWSDLLVARWGGMRVLASQTSDDAFSKDQTHIRGILRTDVGVRHLASFVVAS